MKKLLLALVLCTSFGLQAAESMDTSSDAAEVAEAQEQVVKVLTGDGQEFKLPVPTPFQTINNIFNDLGNEEGDAPIPLGNIDAKTLQNALSLYSSGALPENQDELAPLIRALDFLE